MRVREANEILGRIKTPMDGYKALAAAIILTACDDYMRAAGLKDTMRMETIEKFFLSDRFLLYSDGADGAYVLRKVKEAGTRTAGKGTAIPVKCIDEQGNVVAEYASLGDAAARIRGDRRSIVRACNSGKILYGYYWRWA